MFEKWLYFSNNCLKVCVWKFIFHLKVSTSHAQALEGEAASGWEEGVDSSRAPSPIRCGHGWVQARPDLLGTHMAAGTALLFSGVRQGYCTDRRKDKEWKMRGWIIVSVFMAKKKKSPPRSDLSATCWMQKMVEGFKILTLKEKHIKTTTYIYRSGCVFVHSQ